MGRQIIQQPNGKFAVWSSIVNDFVLEDATVGEIIEEWVQEKREQIETDVTEKCKALLKGEKPYFQFTMTHAEACAFRNECHADTEATDG